jgi:Ca2+-binding EF-hand superfamily protein
MAVLTFIASQLAKKDELGKLRDVFVSFDANSDGTLSREELIMGYMKYYNCTKEAAE